MQAEEKSVIIRREIQAPEIDEYDEVSYKNIKTPASEIQLGAFVTYTLT
jgi:hypothetical protein